MKAVDKPKKLTMPKRVIHSAPNLPQQFLVKPADLLITPPKKKQDVKEEKPKKKPNVKKSKDMSKYAFKDNSEEKKFREDYQWLIKKNIVKMMGTPKRRAHTPKQEVVKEEPKRDPKTTGKFKVTNTDQKEKTLKKERAATAYIAPRKYRNLPPIQRSDYFWEQKATSIVFPPNMVPEKRSGLRDLKNIFNDIKTPKQTLQTNKDKEPGKKKTNKIPEKVQKNAESGKKSAKEKVVQKKIATINQKCQYAKTLQATQ